MNRESLELAKKATEEGWDAYKIMAEFIALQKETDAKIAEEMGNDEIARVIRIQ
jgi:hypothetical protein